MSLDFNGAPTLDDLIKHCIKLKQQHGGAAKVVATVRTNDNRVATVPYDLTKMTVEPLVLQLGNHGEKRLEFFQVWDASEKLRKKHNRFITSKKIVRI